MVLRLCAPISNKIFCTATRFCVDITIVIKLLSSANLSRYLNTISMPNK